MWIMKEEKKRIYSIMKSKPGFYSSSRSKRHRTMLGQVKANSSLSPIHRTGYRKSRYAII
jgi:hypothetical protein